jgi:hypothetical protein
MSSAVRVVLDRNGAARRPSRWRDIAMAMLVAAAAGGFIYALARWLLL